jgi:hypothetical protein
MSDPNHAEEGGFPPNWIWAEDGDEVAGRYRSFSTGRTATGDLVPIVQLEVDGVARSVWLFHVALRERFAEEIKTRPDKDLDPGELVTIRRGEERQSASHPDRRYRAYEVEFENRRRLSPLELLQIPEALGATAPPPPDQDIPF